MSEWIKCSERLPEPMQDVLVWSPAFGIAGGEYDVAFQSRFVDEWCGAHISSHSEWDFNEITHWMPLPAPPAEEVKP